MDLHNFRRQYQTGGLRRQDLNPNPIAQFEQWMQELLTIDTPDPTAMVLATVNEQGQPSQRIVLLKEVTERGFVFFTNRRSHKGQDIAQNAQVSLHFPWHIVGRQIIVQGVAHELTKEEDEAYFHSRPQASQWAAWASVQSSPLESRQQLLDKFEGYQQQYPDTVPLPDFWGGYCVVPQQMEFWQGCEDRLHDRFVYEKQDQDWSIQRLSP